MRPVRSLVGPRAHHHGLALDITVGCPQQEAPARPLLQAVDPYSLANGQIVARRVTLQIGHDLVAPNEAWPPPMTTTRASSICYKG